MTTLTTTVSEMNIVSVRELLSQAAQLPADEFERSTLLELAGFPHYENVASNILAYYADPANEHGLDTLVVEAFISVLGGAPAAYEMGDLEVSREYSTRSGNRIDIVIVAADVVIGIENKINAPTNNDLEDYRSTLHNLATGGEDVYCILLCLREPVDAEGRLPQFRPITYEVYLKELLKRLGPRALDADQRDLNFLFDFIRTMERLSRGTQMDQQVLELFEAQEKTISDLLKHVHSLKSDMRRKVQALDERVDTTPAKEKRFWRKRWKLLDTLSIDLPAENITPVINARIRPSGWKITIFERGGNFDALCSWLIEHQIGWDNETITGKTTRRIVVRNGTFDYTQDQEVAERLNSLLAELQSAGN